MLHLFTGTREEDFLKGFTIYGHGGHLGHVTNIKSTNFYFLFLKTFIQNLV